MMPEAVLEVFYHPNFSADIGQHIMPIRKFGLVAAEIQRDPRLAAGVRVIAPQPVNIEQLLRVHTPEYVEAVRTGQPKALAESQKFPWSPELFGSVCLTSGGVLAAAESALQHGAAAALASGFHHSCADHGEGFCTFNGLIVAGEDLYRRGKIKSLAVLDLDLHFGNGTASLSVSRPWITPLSIYGNDYWNNVPYADVTRVMHPDGESFASAALPTRCIGAQLADILGKNLPRLLSKGKPDLLLYQAGADPYHEDPYSPLALTYDDLLARDRQVFAFAQSHGIPIAWVLAGGYTKEVEKVVKVHVNTFHAFFDVHGDTHGK